MKKTYLIACLLIFAFCAAAQAAQVTLQWDPPATPVTGHMVFTHVEGAVYDYVNPAWTGPGTTCTLTVANGVKHYFVARAYRTENGKTSVSADSNEVSEFIDFLPPPVPDPPKNLLIQAIDEIIQGLNTLKKALAQGGA